MMMKKSRKTGLTNGNVGCKIHDIDEKFHTTLKTMTERVSCSERHRELPVGARKHE